MTEKIKELSPEINKNLVLINKKYHFVNLQTLLRPAIENGFGVAAVNIRSKYILNSALTAAFETKTPLIIEIAESEQGYCNLPPSRISEMVAVKVEESVKKYGCMIPLALHLDHVQKDLSLVDRGIAAGFSSVEIDQSKKPLEENIALTKQVVEKCHPLGISVEGEIGEIGAVEALKDKNLINNLIQYVPTVEETLRLIKETDIDAFAGFFGNGHGKYMATPLITWERIKEIVAALKKEGCLIPLVMHGSSYLETVDFDRMGVFVQAIRCGCHKFNYATVLSNIFKLYLPFSLNQAMEKEAKRQNSSWRKMLGQFEAEIDKVDSERLTNAQAEITAHLKLMFEYAWLSKGKAELYSPKIYTAS